MNLIAYILFIIIALGLLFLGLLGIIKLVEIVRSKIQNSQNSITDVEIKENKSVNKHSNLQNSILKGTPMNNIFDNVSSRFVIVGIIALLMLIPVSTVKSLVDDRYRLYEDVLANIADQWGKPQNIVGPLLVIPIVEKFVTEEKIKDDEGNEKTIVKDIYKNKNLVILPKLLTKQAQMDEHYRYRSIYKSLVYEADLSIKGNFTLPDISEISDNLHQVRYQKSFFVMGLSDTKAINNISELQFGNNQITFSPGVRTEIGGITTGFHANVNLNPAVSEYTFAFNFNTKGSSSIRFSAFGETSDIKVNSKWPHPSFQGAILPTERTVSDTGFSAQWLIPSLARNFPQIWLEENHKYDLKSLLTGVDLYEPVFLYSMIDRTVKYAILLIVLTFLTFLIFEFSSKSRLHYVQYIIIGLSLAMFYLVLLSLSEHILFLYAYLSASLVTIIPISLYSWFNNRSVKQTLAILALLSALYTIIYSLLQLEDYALLLGTGLLLAVLLTLMWITKNLHKTT